MDTLFSETLLSCLPFLAVLNSILHFVTFIMYLFVLHIWCAYHSTRVEVIDNVQELIISFHPESPRIEIRLFVSALRKQLYPLHHVVGPGCLFLISIQNKFHCGISRHDLSLSILLLPFSPLCFLLSTLSCFP